MNSSEIVVERYSAEMLLRMIGISRLLDTLTKNDRRPEGPPSSRKAVIFLAEGNRNDTDDLYCLLEQSYLR
jgi:hypothetical protein